MGQGHRFKSVVADKKCRGRVVGATSSEGFLAGKDNNAIWCNEMT